MKATIRICSIEVGAKQPLGWEEHVIADITTEREAEIWAYHMLERFNTTRREGERARRVVHVEFIPNEGRLRHDWEKSNLVTLSDGTDRCRCRRCGATGVRYGLGEFQTDKKSLKKFPNGCPG